MGKPTLAKTCYVLLLACIPASLVPVVWISPGMREWVQENALWLGKLLYLHTLPAMPAWIQYTAVQTLVAALLVCAAGWYLLRRGRLLGPALGRRNAFPMLVVAYAGWAALTCLWSVWPYASRAYVIRELPFYILAVAAYYLCARRERWVTVAWVLLISAALAGALQGGVVHWMARDRGISLDESFKRYAVVYSNRNFGGSGLVMALLLAIGLGWRLVADTMANPPDRPPGKMRRVAVLALVAAAGGVAMYVLLLAGALAAGIALVVALTAYVICMVPLRRKWPLVLPLFLAGAIIAIIVLADTQLWTHAGRWAWSPRRTAHVRMVNAISCHRLYSRRPLHGWGMGTFPATYAQFQPAVARTLRFTRDVRTTHPHCEAARVVTDQGLVGLLLYVGVIGYALVAAYSGVRNEPSRFRFAACALWASALGFIVQANLGKAAMNWSFSANMWVLLGVLASAARRQGSPTDEAARQEAAGAAPAPPWRWALLMAAAALTVWGWYEWGAGSYASNVYLNQAIYLQKNHLRAKSEVAEAVLKRFTAARDAARRRCLWPDDMLHMDYVEGWFLTSIGQFERAVPLLEKVQELAPEFMDTRLHLAESYARLGNEAKAQEHLMEFMRRDPYELTAYGRVYRQDPAAAIRMLEEHVYGRLQQTEDWVIEDYPTFDEVRRLLSFYASRGRWREAQALAANVEEFFATAEVSKTVRPLAAVRSLVRWFRSKDMDREADGLLLAFPEARRPAAQQPEATKTD